MATILMAWELGVGLGHIAPLKPLAEELLRRGHRVTLALRHMARAPVVFGDLPVACLPAPYDVRPSDGAAAAPVAYVHLLENIGFNDPAALALRVAQWRTIFDAVKPDLLLCEHSPTALLAARGHAFRRVLLGTGFNCPPCGETLPLLRPWRGAALDQVRADEARVTSTLNRLLASNRAPPLKTLPDLYRQVDETFIISFAELDHFDRVRPCEYHGVWSLATGESFAWPAGDGPRVFAYLKPAAAVRTCLRQLATWKFPTLVYSDGLDGSLLHEFSSATLQFTRHPLDMRQVGVECDLGICNANHSTVAALLRAGRPLFVLPITLEQTLLAISVKRQGLAAASSAIDASGAEAWLRIAFENQVIREAASRFAAKYARFDDMAATVGIVDRVERLACGFA